MTSIFILCLKIFLGLALLALVVALALLLDGADRIVHGRMQRPVGPPLLQPGYHIVTLMGK